MRIGAEFKQLAANRAAELHAAGLTEGILEEKTMGGIKVYLDKKPMICLLAFQIDDQNSGMHDKTVYVGAESLF